MNIINVVGNAIGIFLLRAGVAGVAVPSLISRVFAAVVMLILSLNQKNTLCIMPRQVAVWNSEMLRRILTVAVPNGIENGLFQISKVALSSIVALFGTIEIAANGVAQSFWSMAALFCIAFNIGNAILCPLAFSLSNGLRAAGDIRYTMLASIFATVICRVFFSELFGV